MLQPSKIHSTLDARDVRPLVCGQDFDVEDWNELGNIGIGFQPGVLNEMLNASRFAMDSIQQPVSVPSIATPVQFLQSWLPGFVPIVTAARKIDELIGMTTVGSWEDEEIVQPFMENSGSPEPYGDLTNVPLANWNTNFLTRTVVRFEQGMRVGSLEEARAARMRVNSGQAKRESCALVLEIERNAVGFYGYNSGLNLTYGFLNDPNLPAYVQVAAGALTTRTWATKTFQEIKNDLLTSYQGLRTTSQDTIDPEHTDITLGVATNAVDYLSQTTDFGISVKDWIKQTYPRTRIVSSPQLNTAGTGNTGAFYMYADKVADAGSDDQRTFLQVVPAKFMVLGVQKHVKGFEEDYSNATAGVMVKRPYAVKRYYGIS